MAPLARDRKINSKWQGRALDAMDVAADTVIYGGSLYARNLAGNAVPASDTAGLLVRGVAQAQADNTDGSAGDVRVMGVVGVYEFDNDGTNPIAADDIGRVCYVKDDHTVQDEGGGSKVVAGIVEALSPGATKVWVYVDEMVGELAGTEGGGIETVVGTVGGAALSIDIETSFLSVTGTVGFTLGDGKRLGQRKVLECTVAATVPVGTVTINDRFGSEQATWVFTEVGQRLELIWTTTGWKVDAIRSAGTESLAAAATANPLCLIHLVNLDAANDYIQPSGVIPGQKSIWIATAGANASTVSGLFYDEDGSADGVDITMNAAADTASLEWVGGRWFAHTLVSAPVS
jgi:hypothetical protein